MKYLYIKFIRDMKSLWAQFFSVFMMAMISITIFSGMSAVWTGMNKSATEYMNDTNLADAFVYVKAVNDDKLNKIRDLEYIDVAEPSMTITVEVMNQEQESDLMINTFQNNTLKVMNPIVRSGAILDENLNGIWIDEDYANSHNLKVGDHIDIGFESEVWQTEIKGIVLDSENIFFITSPTESLPNHEQHGYAYMNEQYAKKLFENFIYNQVRLQINENTPITKEKIQDDMKYIIEDSFYSISLKEDRISITQVEEEQDQIKKMAVLFSVVFLLLAILTMYTTMSRVVNNQIVQIGTMKALGMSRRQVYVHYALYGFIVSLLGCVCGVCLGTTLVTGLVMKIKQSTLTLPIWYKKIGMDSIGLILLVVFICTVSAVITARKVICTVPALTILGQLEQKIKKNKELKRSKLSYRWLWTIRGIKVHPARYAMGVIAVAGSLVLMVSGIGVWDSLTSSYDEVFEKEYSYQYVGNIRKTDYEQIKDRFKNYEVQFGKLETATFFYGNKEIEGMVSIFDCGDLIHLFDNKTREEIMIPSNGAIITNKIAKKLNLKEGDTITYRTSNSLIEKESKITSIVDAKLPQGIFIASSQVEAFTPNTIYIADKNGYDFAIQQDDISGLFSIEKQRSNVKEMMNSVHSIMYILILAAFLLSAVILYNLGILNFIERYREYATMKVLGFYKKELVGMVLEDCFLNLILGLLIGIPLSKVFLKIYVEIVSMDNMEWTPYITSAHFVAIVSIVIIFSILISLLVCRKISKVNMVEALKSVE